MNGQASPQPDASQTEQQQGKKGLLFEILFTIIFLILIFGILNYFNILRLSAIFPNYLGFLPHKEVSNGTSQQSQQYNNVTIAPPVRQSFPILPSYSPSEQAKQTLVNFLPTILNTSILPASPSGITLTEDQTSPQTFIASWKTKEKNIDSSIHMSHDLKKIIAVDFYTKDSELLSSISRETAESKATQFFSINPKGIWGCKNVIIETMLYCENFYEQTENSKRGLGALIITSPAGNRVVYYLCEHSQASELYSWKSCKPEFLKTGVK